ncbi:MAG: hypothetical protein HZC28_14780 [Spirochaetes bacterium]|nr:hypothetical protein [Spirochaetota bacterium]
MPKQSSRSAVSIGSDLVKEMRTDASTKDGKAGRVVWYTDNTSGKPVAKGVYLCVVQLGDKYRTVRVMVLR